ncbi:hypothetical protein H5410_040897 [Solanum commersonii]|uniref:Uncharacterized protein n=1 Tax=Solanum commersonii TaxID=4109 RepID=A0A9J5XS56_SOLCO|nr:hypothetical protein H5410_040897 [Solanum commersonii]
MYITPLQTQVINHPLNVPPNKPSVAGPVNTIPEFDEYGTFSPHMIEVWKKKFNRFQVNKNFHPEVYTMAGFKLAIFKMSTLSLQADQTLGSSLQNHLNDRYTHMECKRD